MIASDALKFLRISLIVIAFGLSSPASRAGTANPHLLPIQGYVTNSAGTPITNTLIAVRIYSSLTGDDLIWSSGYPGGVQGGAFNVVIGLEGDLNLDNTFMYFMEIDIAGEEVVGDASGGRLAFYPGGGDHTRGDLSVRLAALESAVGTRIDSIRVQRSSGGPSAATADQIRYASVGIGAPAGQNALYATLGALLLQPVGVLESTSYKLRLGPFYMPFASQGCCAGIRGNADGDSKDITDVGDLTYLISFLFLGGVSPDCPEEANIDGSGPIDVGDLTALIGFLFLSGGSPVDCP